MSELKLKSAMARDYFKSQTGNICGAHIKQTQTDKGKDVKQTVAFLQSHFQSS